MSCNEYSIDISAIEDNIKEIKDGNIRKQIINKIKKVKQNPVIGEHKRYGLKDYQVVKVNNQRIVIVYKFDDKNPCMIVFVIMEEHDKAYERTFSRK